MNSTKIFGVLVGKNKLPVQLWIKLLFKEVYLCSAIDVNDKILLTCPEQLKEKYRAFEFILHDDIICIDQFPADFWQFELLNNSIFIDCDDDYTLEEVYEIMYDTQFEIRDTNIKIGCTTDAFMIYLPKDAPKEDSVQLRPVQQKLILTKRIPNYCSLRPAVVCF
jgi:hypothetical protein